jgi:hypothetical protein
VESSLVCAEQGVGERRGSVIEEFRNATTV